MKKLTIEGCLDNFAKVHSDTYDYSKIVYTNSSTKVCIICKIHGEYWQSPNAHQRGDGCRECGKISGANIRRSNGEDFITKACKIHGDKYDYSNTIYVHSKKKVQIICKKHGEFRQRPNDHLLGKGCPECKKEVISSCHKSSKKDFVFKARKIHGHLYDYSMVSYMGGRVEVKIGCKIHGYFWQTPFVHLHIGGCPSCGFERTKKKLKSTTEEFIYKAKLVHPENKYGYSKTVYVGNNKDRVCISCSVHGDFWQKPNQHLCGQGCPKCFNSRGESLIENWLVDNNIVFVREHRYADLKGLRGIRFRFDFYIPTINLLLEYDGEQHFRPACFNGVSKKQAMKNLSSTQHNDALKNKYCADKYYCEYYFTKSTRSSSNDRF